MTSTPTPTGAGAGTRGIAGTHPLARTGLLARSLARRGRWGRLAWVACLVGVLPATSSAYRTTVPEGPAGRDLAASLAGSPTMRALLGPPYDLLHVGPFVMWRVGTFTVAMAGVMAVLAVVRATRGEEEDGRLELLRSGAVGRHAPLAAAVLVALADCLLVGLLGGLSLVGPSGDPGGSLLLGLGIALGGAVWVGVGAVAAQLCAGARAARGWALGALAAAYVVRALADGASRAPVALPWLSPLEWPALARPYADPRPWVLLLPAALTGVLLATACLLETGRDLGAGARRPRPGPARASARLDGPGPLAWRLARGSVVGWTVGMVLGGLATGSLASGISTMLRDSPQLTARFRRMGAGATDLRDAFWVAMLGILAPLAAMLALQLWGMLRREEGHGRAELLLSTAVSRGRLLGAHLLVAALAPSLVLLATGAALALPQVGALGPGVVGTLLGAAAAQLPGVLLVLGLAVAVHGWAPRLGLLPWLVVGWSLAMSWVGAVLGLPDAVVRATPFARLPQLPAHPVTWAPVVVTTLLAVLLAGVGALGYRRRDLAGG